MEKITYQEIDVKLHLIFTQKQLHSSNSALDLIIKQSLLRECPLHESPMEVTEVESSMSDAYIRVTTSTDIELSDVMTKLYILKRVRDALPFGLDAMEILSFREEAEIYGNK